MILYVFFLDILYPFISGVTFNIENEIVDDNSNSVCSAFFLSLFFIHFDGGFIFVVVVDDVARLRILLQ